MDISQQPIKLGIIITIIPESLLGQEPFLPEQSTNDIVYVSMVQSIASARRLIGVIPF
jgi:hypothetical protein